MISSDDETITEDTVIVALGIFDVITRYVLLEIIYIKGVLSQLPTM